MNGIELQYILKYNMLNYIVRAREVIGFNLTFDVHSLILLLS